HRRDGQPAGLLPRPGRRARHPPVHGRRVLRRDRSASVTDFVEDAAPVAAPAGLRHAFSSLRHRDYALFFGAAAISNTGNWMQTITVPYVIYAITRSTTWLGFTAFMNFFPAVLIGPVSGAIADRFSRRAVLMVTLSVQMLVALALWALWVSG